MPHVITDLCMREGGCAVICPVECIVPGKPQEEWPWFYIDRDTCIDCGACAAQCPFNAIFPEDEVPSAYKATGGERISASKGTAGFDEVYEWVNHDGAPIHLDHTRTLEPGEIVNLRPAIGKNTEFFTSGPGYKA